MAEQRPAGNYPVDLTVEYPEGSSKVLATLGIIFFLKGVLLLPHFIVLYFLGLACVFAIWIAFIAVLINGSYPRSIFDFTVGVQRWNLRANAWFSGWTDKYPPFSLS